MPAGPQQLADEYVESPNYSKGRAGFKPFGIVIHSTEGTMESAIAWFLRPNSQVSAHFIIGRDGRIVQMVDCNNTAWHAGAIHRPSWPLLIKNKNPNLYTIGIEHERMHKQSLTSQQLVASANLIAALSGLYDIPIDGDHIVRHHRINGKKTCPTPFIPLGV